jgi:Tfp pilus assembly PilM family ATPase
MAAKPIYTDVSEESILKDLKNQFAPKVILVNHEKRLTVDTTCANLAIKYNLVYISVYQLIKQHIETNTEFGRKLLATKRPRDIKLQVQAKDEFLEIEYSAVHYELPVVMELVSYTIQKVRKASQKYILIEGFCNASKLIFDQDKLELRYMDEFFNIEKSIGEVAAVIGL